MCRVLITGSGLSTVLRIIADSHDLFITVTTPILTFTTMCCRTYIHVLYCDSELIEITN